MQQDSANVSMLSGVASDGGSLASEAATTAMCAESQSASDRLNELKPVWRSIVADIEGSYDSDVMKQWRAKSSKRYHASLNTPERLAKHNAIMHEFTGDGSIPNPGPLVAEASEHFNPLFEMMWEPWARKAQYICQQDLDLSAAGGEGSHNRRKIAIALFSWAVPTLPLLKFMVDNSPNRKIAEIGSGKGCWAALLSRMGADVVAVDNGYEYGGDYGGPAHFPDTIICDGVEFVQGGSADDRALFFCWARRGDMPARCISAYKGDTLFFVGENNDGATFDVYDWLESEEGKEWKVEIKKVPTWVGIHDYFMMCKRVGREQVMKNRVEKASL